MGFVFRKSAKLGSGLRLNFSKRGFGISGGIPGARISINSRGRISSSLGIPGTGMRFTESANLKSGRKSKQKSKPNHNQPSNDYQNSPLNFNSREETLAYLEEFQINRTKFFRHGGRLLLALLIVVAVSGISGQGDFAGGVFAVAWFLGVALMFSYIRRVTRSKRAIAKKFAQSKD